jgi:hypothetical protein
MMSFRIGRILIFASFIVFMNSTSFAEVRKVENLHSVEITDNRSGKKIKAQAGVAVDPSTGKKTKYRFFVDPQSGDLVEQFLQGKDASGKDKVYTLRSKAKDPSKLLSETPIETPIQSKTNSIDNHTADLIAGAALAAPVVAFAGITAGFWIYDLIQQKKRCAAYFEEVPPEVKSLPKSFRVAEGGRKVSKNGLPVGGLLPTSQVPKEIPRLKTEGGREYIVSRSPLDEGNMIFFLSNNIHSPYFLNYALVQHYSENVPGFGFLGSPLNFNDVHKVEVQDQAKAARETKEDDSNNAASPWEIKQDDSNNAASTVDFSSSYSAPTVDATDYGSSFSSDSGSW